MKATTHALVGGLIGALAGRPGVAFVGGVASHALLDALPHRDAAPIRHVIADGCGALALLALAVLTGHVGLAAGVLGGVLPDLENVPNVLFGRKTGKIFPSHWWSHERPAGGRWPVLESVVFVAAAIGLAVVLHRTAPDGMLK